MKKLDLPIFYLAGAEIFIWAGLYYIFPALLVKWESALGWSRVDLTGAITLAIFTSAFFSPIAGKLIDQGKGHILMTMSAIVGGIGLYCLSMITSIIQFYVIWAIIGATLSGCLYEPCFALITRCRGAQAKNSIILVTLIAGFASSLCFPVAHSLSDAYGWQTAVRFFSGLVIFVGAPLCWLGATGLGSANKLTQPDHQQTVDKTDSYLLLPLFWFLAIGFSFCAIVHGVTLHHLLPILNDRGILSDVAVTIAAFIGPMQIAGRLAMMVAFRHTTNHGIAISCFIVIGSSSLLLLVAGNTLVLLVGFVIVFGAGYGMVSVIRPIIARDLLGEKNFGTKSGTLALFYLVGAGSAPFLGSLLWKLGGYQLVLPILFALSIAGLGLYLLAAKLARK